MGREIRWQILAQLLVIARVLERLMQDWLGFFYLLLGVIDPLPRLAFFGARWLLLSISWKIHIARYLVSLRCGTDGAIVCE